MSESGRSFEARILPLIEALLETQKSATRALETATVKSGQVETELVKLSRQGLRSEAALSELQSEVVTQFAAVNKRLDAVIARLSEIEQHVDLNAADIKAAQSETISQQNGIINALQTALNGLTETSTIKDRLDRIERRTGL